MAMMTPDELLRRDQELVALVASRPDFHPSATSDFIQIHDKDFHYVGDVLMHDKSGQTAKEYFDAKDGDINRDHGGFFMNLGLDILEQAFGERPSLSKHGEVVKAYGLEQAEIIAQKFGTKLGTLKPGRRPDNIDAPPPEQPKPGNPWTKAYFSLKRQGEIYKIDPKLAANLAAQARSYIGAIHPTI